MSAAFLGFPRSGSGSDGGGRGPSPSNASSTLPAPAAPPPPIPRKNSASEQPLPPSGTNDSEDMAALEAEAFCPVCFELLAVPVTAPCGHTYCRKCIIKAAAAGKEECPVCRTPLSAPASSLKENKLAAALVARVRGFVARRELVALAAMAEKGDVEALVELAKRYRTGKGGVAQKLDEAFRLYSVAAGAGHVDAQFQAAYALHGGHGVPKDTVAAAEWYAKAAAAGHETATYNLGCLVHLGVGGGARRDMRRAAELFGKSGALGNSWGYAGLAAMHLDGDLGPEGHVDAGAAFFYAKLALDKDPSCTPAKVQMGRLCRSGWPGAAANPARAFELLSEVASADLSSAYAHLGVLYEEGVGTPASLPKALEWYRKGVDAGKPEAEFRLALLMRDGRGVPRDAKAAAEMLKKAAQQGHHASIAALAEGGGGGS